eukprot:403357329
MENTFNIKFENDPSNQSRESMLNQRENNTHLVLKVQHDQIPNDIASNIALTARIIEPEELKQSEIQRIQDIQQHQKSQKIRSIHIFQQLKSKPVELLIFSYLPKMKAQLLIRSLAFAGIVQCKNLVQITENQNRYKDIVAITIQNKMDLQNTLVQFQVLKKVLTYDVRIILRYAPDNRPELLALMLFFTNQSYDIKEVELRDIDSTLV